MQYIHGDEIDRRMLWPPGKAERLARRRALPHVILPDGSIRFEWDEIEPLIVPVRAAAAIVQKHGGRAPAAIPEVPNAK